MVRRRRGGGRPQVRGRVDADVSPLAPTPPRVPFPPCRDAVARLTGRPGPLAGPGFEPCPEVLGFVRSTCKVLVIGAGGLGCELLKDLALLGFAHIDVIDMDTIDETNLNRQFLFRAGDVGKSKAVCAAAAINRRISGVQVTAHHKRIEDKDPSFYEDFHVIVLGLDSIEARSWINDVCCSFLEFDEDSKVDQSTIKPLIDGGTEGFKGHARVILPGVSPCFQCTMWLFPPQTKFPLCTLAETPRTPAHCIEYAHLIQWDKERPGDSFDADSPEDMKWIYEKALARAESFGIQGVTYSLTQGVVKNIVPAIASTNAIVAATCAQECFKLVTMCSQGLDNYVMYMGGQGIYTHTVSYERDPTCLVCGAGVPVKAPAGTTLREYLGQVAAALEVKKPLIKPGLFHGATPLFAGGAYEAMTKRNLDKTMDDLVGASGLLTVTDKALFAPLRVQYSISA